MITETIDGMKNSKEKRKLSVNKWCCGEFLINLFIYKEKNNLQKNIKKNIRESLTYKDDLVKFL